MHAADSAHASSEDTIGLVTRMMLLPRFVYVALVMAVGFGCHRHRDWDRVEEFEGALRCGMTVTEVGDLAEKLGASEFKKPQLAGQPDIPDYFVSENERLISLWFDGDGGLTAYMSAISSMEHDEEGSPTRVDLCQHVPR